MERGGYAGRGLPAHALQLTLAGNINNGAGRQGEVGEVELPCRVQPRGGKKQMTVRHCPTEEEKSSRICSLL